MQNHDAAVDLVVLGWLCRAARARRPVPAAVDFRTNARATPRPLCAICVKRDAVTTHKMEGVEFRVCIPCRDEDIEDPTPAGPAAPRARVLSALARFIDGAEVADIAAALGEEDEKNRVRIYAVLARAMKVGLVTATGGKNDRTYHLVRHG
jgi:hypothetical protein